MSIALRHILALLALCCLLCPASAVHSAPLLQEGKKSLFQRVVSHPGAILRAEPKVNAPVLSAKLTPFSVLYVFARQEGWLQVGLSTGQPQGWLEAADTTAWNQSLTLLFSPPTGRDPVLFFKDEKTLSELCAAQDMEARLNALLAASRTNSTDRDLPVIACEPSGAQGAVSEKRFYLMPILAMKDPFEGVKFLQVASIDPGDYNRNSTTGAAAGGKEAGPPKTGIALVIDTTISMKPYIEQSRNVVREIYDSIEKDKLADHVGFAVVTYRSSTAAVPGLEYVSTVVSDFATAKDRTVLESRLAQVREATVSSHDFNEDALAGVCQAVESLSWEDYSSRLILLITDAGPLKSSDKYASVKMGVNEVNDFARQKGIWVTTLHIKSPGGAANHRYAEESYRALSRLS
ncbi:MAG: vWA domain-containing protein, partial [Desulfovibrionaceae bacterium]|nr:vWA domain-containing protein [Desulfovibrionaceae bacterium]